MGWSTVEYNDKTFYMRPEKSLRTGVLNKDYFDNHGVVKDYAFEHGLYPPINHTKKAKIDDDEEEEDYNEEGYDDDEETMRLKKRNQQIKLLKRFHIVNSQEDDSSILPSIEKLPWSSLWKVLKAFDWSIDLVGEQITLPDSSSLVHSSSSLLEWEPLVFENRDECLGFLYEHSGIFAPFGQLWKLLEALGWTLKV